MCLSVVGSRHWISLLVVALAVTSSTGESGSELGDQPVLQPAVEPSDPPARPQADGQSARTPRVPDSQPDKKASEGPLTTLRQKVLQDPGCKNCKASEGRSLLDCFPDRWAGAESTLPDAMRSSKMQPQEFGLLVFCGTPTGEKYSCCVSVGARDGTKHTWWGSGVVVNVEGNVRIMTACHVAHDKNRGREANVIGLSDTAKPYPSKGESAGITLLAESVDMDIAWFSVDDSDIACQLMRSAATIAPKSGVVQDQWVRAVGFGYGVGDNTVGTRRSVMVTVVAPTCDNSARSNYGCEGDWQFVCSNRPDLCDTCNGDSGGPVLLLGDAPQVLGFTDKPIPASKASQFNPPCKSPCGCGGLYVFAEDAEGLLH